MRSSNYPKLTGKTFLRQKVGNNPTKIQGPPWGEISRGSMVWNKSVCLSKVKEKLYLVSSTTKKEAQCLAGLFGFGRQ